MRAEPFLIGLATFFFDLVTKTGDTSCGSCDLVFKTDLKEIQHSLGDLVEKVEEINETVHEFDKGNYSDSCGKVNLEDFVDFGKVELGWGIG